MPIPFIQAKVGAVYKKKSPLKKILATKAREFQWRNPIGYLNKDIEP